MPRRVRSGFAKQGLMRTLGATLEEVEPGRCTVRVGYAEGLTQQHGLFHGGVSATLADNAAGFAAYTLMEDGEQPLTVEFKINFLAPARGEALEAHARVVRAGRRLKHVQAEVYALEDGGPSLVALALATIASTRAVQETE